ncbi:XPG/Rad2 endonuclease protein [Dioscorea alata]|uniref:XPG/Rad2 endonuclease protein n=2 Tax=Dioscorea alata TaxID=55571 RepID=A0ACB7UMI9_DIOAL|nr:XPG/Rad2 endonuclease protein [Dioscorea alata]KAH7661727.1 XPG/Rad2 endonuclease protein [Dioscorea alata]
MGVQGLWELLAPVGRRVSVETLAGKTLAIDASIWMVQFMMAMRDERGEMVRNAHVLGFFRRICKLLFLRTKPIFVFDGATPALKRRTVAARRRHRENARAKIRKTAEKLLINHLKAKRLEELAAEIKNSRVKDESKGKQVEVDHGSGLKGSSSEKNVKDGIGNANQETIDELLAASLAAEEEGKFNSNESASGVDAFEEGVDEDENEEMLFPAMSGKIDPAVLASLPPSMQLDLLVQMRERLMAENRQKYQKIKKAPAKFSELQIQSYLKTVAFRREIDEVQKCAAGRGVGGVHTSRIASEANREFIFSSSFTGDKQILTSAANGMKENMKPMAQNNATSSDPVLPNSASKQSRSVMGACITEPISDFVNDVETYRDERGRVRVSRVRGMGICMTRDLQRNLDLMKEYEQEKNSRNICNSPTPNSDRGIPKAPKDDSEINPPPKACAGSDTAVTDAGSILASTQGEIHHVDETSVLASKTTIEISFLEDEIEKHDADHNLFLQLVSGSSALETNSVCVSSGKDICDSADCMWEEGMVEENAGSQTDSTEKQSRPFSAEEISGEEDDVEWEEGTCQGPTGATDGLTEHRSHISRGFLEEEADVQEAIKRSLEDLGRQKPLIISSEVQTSNTNMQVQNNLKCSFAPRFAVGGHGKHNACQMGIVQTRSSPEMHQASPAASEARSVNDEMKSNAEIIEEPVVVSEITETLCTDDDAPKIQSVEGQVTLDTECMNISKHGSTSNTFAELEPSSKADQETIGNTPVIVLADCQHNDLQDSLKRTENAGFQKNSPLDTECMNISKHGSTSNTFAELEPSSKADQETIGNTPVIVLADCQHNDLQDSLKRTENEGFQKNSPLETFTETAVHMDVERQNQEKIINDIPSNEEKHYEDKFMTQEHLNDNLEFSEASLDEEISILRQERLNLGDKQRMLERNAESVSSEMFAECQELLQMFGLPYIIAPMEAEAQCAYMEMTKQVDGVITDDSDVFLFGARNVYKNIFDDKKYVETYFMKDIESELGMTREKLIRMALLLGSDYTEGVSGIGIVNAIEVLQAFPEEDGLQKFREWLESPDPSILGQFGSYTGSKSKKRSSKTSNSNVDELTDNSEESACEVSGLRNHDQVADNGIPDVKNIFMNKHRKVSKNWHIPSSFPSESVVSAYTSPQVDESLESFSWGRPDLFLLRKLCWEKFGWGSQKADELLVPVLKEYNKHETQLRLEAFYSFNERFAKIRSQRIKKAVKGITGSSELTGDIVQEGSESRKGKRASRAKEPKHKNQLYGGTNDDCMEPLETLLSGDKAGKSPIPGHGREVAESGMTANIRGRGRGSVSKSGRGRGVKARGRSKLKKKTEPSKGSSSDASDDADDAGGQNKKQNDTFGLRRSLRQRKHVKYAEEAPGAVNDADVVDASNTIVADHKSTESSFPLDGKHGNPDFTEDYSPKDYLLSGGGFCVDESDQNGDAVNPTNLQTDSTKISGSSLEIAHPASLQGLLVQDDPNPIEVTQVPALVQNDYPHPEQDVGQREARPGLSAMPSLKRKRRKT